ncbi:MAG: ABC transporter permease [Meiothermus sp.]|uniref:ABC transporter permease n=1 Tax=Meiothermus sp. TaxID=1955249 RepID=UPI0025EF824B|nr:ABC transporter permease [Meiothermus sp.]MCS7058760.1 ABC transporter permease [Meiothermus sp.]MCS7195379.1 ABC transporter permease [Meiothermus sp.]MDW8091020.1 ABC transporter permease [Meiothermus sp.]MDW8482235.1 ABC transporter permease [Meiothermus sp.]
MRYALSKAAWYFMAFLAAVVLNYFLPRLIPGNPVDTIVARMAQGGGSEGEARQQMYQTFLREFGLDRPPLEQFLNYLGNLLQGDLGTSFGNYPAKVADLIAASLPWTVALQLPAILLGWILGNWLGVLAAYRGGWVDRWAFLGFLTLSNIPYYCLAILLLYAFSVALPLFPSFGGYAPGTTPHLSLDFILNVLHHYTLPFLSLVLVLIGGQAVGMRSMAIYELSADYVHYLRSLGVSDRRIVWSIFRNAMLPQVTGLALAIGSLVGGALLTEVVFSYPGIGSLLFTAIRQNDYPLIQGITLLVTVAVLAANFIIDLTYGLIDPRIRSAQVGER